MRPNVIETGAEMYECHSCGARSKKTDRGLCPECGGPLQHLGRSRDL